MMKTITISTIDGKSHKESVHNAKTITADAQVFEDIWGERIVMWNNSAIHCDDGPAVVGDGVEQYWFSGTKYSSIELWERRKELESHIDEDGNRCWSHIQNREILHRDDGGPAVEYKGGQRWEWWQDGELHRDGRPAVIDNEIGIIQYYADGSLHNAKGAAVVNNDGIREYYFYGERMTEDNYFNLYGPLKEVKDDGIQSWSIMQGLNKLYHRISGPAYISAYGDEFWYKNGKQHRESGPASIYVSGEKQWIRDGLLHREDGPAVEYSNGDKEWFIEGKRHNENGPAVECIDGTKEWWTNDKLICKEGHGMTEYFDDKRLWHSPLPSIPAITYKTGESRWYSHGKLHRESGPAIVFPDGRKEWYIDGRRHNTKGPAVEYSSGRRAWYLNDARVTKKEFDEFLRREKSSKTVKINMNKVVNESARDEIFYLVYAATHRAYQTKRSQDDAPYHGGDLKFKYTANSMATDSEIEKIMAYAVYSAASGYGVSSSGNIAGTLRAALKSSHYNISSDNPYSVYMIAWSTLNVDENINLLVRPEMSKALRVAENGVGEPLMSYQDFLWEYAPAQARAEDLDDSGGWAGPALSILAAAAVGAFTGSAILKKKAALKKKMAKVEHINAI